MTDNKLEALPKLARSQPRTLPHGALGSAIAAGIIAVCGVGAIIYRDRVPEAGSLFALGVSLIMIAAQIMWTTRAGWSRAGSTSSWRDDWRGQLGKSSDGRPQQIATGIFGGVAITLFLVPLNTMLLFNSEIPAEARLIVVPVVGLFDLTVVVSFGYTIYQALQLWRFGVTEVRYAGGPLHTGGDIQLLFHGHRRLSNGAAEARLVCVQESMIRHGRSAKSAVTIEFRALFDQTKTVFSDSLGQFSVSFEVPEAAPSTAFRAAPAVYWELEVTFAERGYHSIFLLPIYGRGH